MRQDLKEQGSVALIFNSISTRKASHPACITLVKIEGGAMDAFGQLPIGMPSILSRERIGVGGKGSLRGARS